MSSIETYNTSGQVTERWDYDSRTYTRFNTDGTTAEQRPFTDQENADADAHQAELSRLTTQQQALTTLAGLTGQVQAQAAQAQADAAAWPTADAATRDAIMGRVLSGLAQITQALGELGVHLGIGQ